MGKGPEKQGPTAQERALTQVSIEQWNDYVQRYQPAERALADRIKVTDAERASVGGQVSADVAGAFKGLTRDTLASNAAAGAKTGSGKSKLALAANNTARGSALAAGRSEGELGLKLGEDEQNLQLAGFGRGLARDATVNLARGAQNATRVALAESAARFERNAAMRQAAGTIAGAGFQKWRLRQPELGIDTSKLPKRRDGSTPSTAGSPVFTGVQPGWTNIPDNYT